MGNGKPPCMSQKPDILEEEGESKSKRKKVRRVEEKRREEKMTVALTEAATEPVHERGVHTLDSQSG